MSDYPTWDSGKSAKVIAVGGRYSISRVYKAVYDSNREVFRTWGYQTNDGERISLGDKAAFLAATKVYDKPLDIGNNIGKRFVTETDCVNADCAEVAKGLIDCGLNPAILNLASRHHACGGYDSGAGAQEESLCRVSTLSQTLYQYFDPSLRCRQPCFGGVRVRCVPSAVGGRSATIHECAQRRTRVRRTIPGSRIRHT